MITNDAQMLSDCVRGRINADINADKRKNQNQRHGSQGCHSLICAAPASLNQKRCRKHAFLLPAPGIEPCVQHAEVHTCRHAG